MAGGPLYTAEEDETLLGPARYANADQLAVLLPDRNPEGAGNRRKLLGRKRGIAVGPQADPSSIHIPLSTKQIFDEAIVVEEESAVVITDPHIPFHDASFLNDVLNTGLAWGIDVLIVGGDLLDVAAYSRFIADPNDTLEEEFSAADGFFSAVVPHFRRIIWTLGNHEARALGGAWQRQVKAGRFLRMFTDAENVEISSYEYSILRPPSMFKQCGCRYEDRYEWRIAHPKNASVVSGRVPELIASRKWTTSHVISGHGHLAGKVRSEDGRRHAIDSGTCADTRRIEYLRKGVSTRPEMNQGAVIVWGQDAHLVTPQTDFNALRKQYAVDPSIQKGLVNAPAP